MLSAVIYTGILCVFSFSMFFEKKKRREDTILNIHDLSSAINGTSESKQRPTLKEQIKVLFSDIPYICMFISAGLVFGTLGSIGTSLNVIVYIWGYEEVYILLIRSLVVTVPPLELLLGLYAQSSILLCL